MNRTLTCYASRKNTDLHDLVLPCCIVFSIRRRKTADLLKEGWHYPGWNRSSFGLVIFLKELKVVVNLWNVFFALSNNFLSHFVISSFSLLSLFHQIPSMANNVIYCFGHCPRLLIPLQILAHPSSTPHPNTPMILSCENCLLTILMSWQVEV